MVALLIVLLCMNWSLNAAESAQKHSPSKSPAYVPIGIDNIDVNLQQLQLERRFITDTHQRESFILLCQAAEKAFADHARVHEIRQLKEQELKQSKN